jgi:hypothetical protein
MAPTRTPKFLALSIEGAAEYRRESKLGSSAWAVLIALCQHADYRTAYWTGRLDRKRPNVISSRIVGGSGGVIRPYVPAPEVVHIDQGRIAALEATVKRLEGAIRDQLENRRQGL